MGKVLQRVRKFDRNDWRHIGFLMRNCLVQCCKLNFKEAREALIWVWIHMSYDSKLVQGKDNGK